MRLTIEEKQMVLELYKCHFTAKEIVKQFTNIKCSYCNITIMFRGFKAAEIKQYDRLELLGGRTDYDTSMACNG
jgi:hypothetical protein